MSIGPQCSEGTIPAAVGNYLTLSQAAKILPQVNGRRIHTSTLWRWTRGLRGVYLQYVRIGRFIMVTEDGLHRFFTELAKLDYERSHSSKLNRRKRRRQTDLQQQRAIQESEAILRKAKIIV
ncbi:MAG TPA: hypothetical protein PLX18_12200 [Anaerohalosphaeraceae bacterium]|jgi:hypothetical protein|nr:hypothetical protein [Smithella sp.]HOT74124.1 hypothetical protein [Anaerohalosphaeraceae bacterium]HQG06975.1 hypothetical protein [Anaerohalosphaeraceae bacterium]HQI08605.1 hypothetical protein [Anaerohalosphaeraceae bacterium]